MIDFSFDEELSDEEVTKEEVLTGYVILPCFKAEVRGEEVKLVCSDFLEWVFAHFFEWCWTGRVHITGSKWEEVNKRE